jgi:adenine specific DNA methylase Mod
LKVICRVLTLATKTGDLVLDSFLGSGDNSGCYSKDDNDRNGASMQ